MRYIIFSIFLTISFIAKSQNLVPNPSFENYTNCPNNAGQVSYANPWVPSISTPDYFNSCTTSSTFSVPVNFSNVNYQIPKTGNAYVGLATILPPSMNIRENISVALTNTLVNNVCYLVKFYVVNTQTYKLANNNLALNFSSNLTTTVGINSTVNLPMHIYKFGNPIISDTLNWTEIMGIYKANGTERYLTIGNFKDNANTKIDTFNQVGNGFVGYYLVDDVGVEQLSAPFWNYKDTTIAIGDSVLIGPAITGLNINWYDSNNNFIANAPAIYVKPNSPTYYTATEDFCGTITTHTINVMATPTLVKDHDLFSKSISIFPNPTINDFTISNLTESSKLKVDITDTQGKSYWSELITIANNKASIKTNLVNGIYFVSITDSISGLKAVKKLVVQK